MFRHVAIWCCFERGVFTALCVAFSEKLVIPWYLNFASYYGMFGTSLRQNFNFKISIGYF
jgi:hypothetical protein